MTPRIPGWLICLVPLALFAVLHFASWSVPGVFMDAVNPDYLVVRLAYGDRSFPFWTIPGNFAFGLLPVMAHLYHGALPFYVGLPAYLVLGTGLVGIRAAEFLFALTCLLGMAAWLRGLRAGWGFVALLLLCLASDPAFILNFRTQFYITALPAGFLLGALALLEGSPTPRRAALAGGLAGIAAYGYFIWLVPVGLLTAAVLLGWQDRGVKRAWLLGLALGLLPFLLGYLLMLAATGGPAGFLRALRAVLTETDATRSGLDFARRLANTAHLARLGWDNAGNTAMVLGTALEPRLAVLRWILLGIAGLGTAWALVARPALRCTAIRLLACAGGFLVLGLVFGDRLWAHHFSSMPIWFLAGFGLALSLLWRVPRFGRAVAFGLAVVLLGVNLLNWRLVARELERTGGRALFSDAIVRFAESVARQPTPPQVFAPDWGVMMPLVMLGEGTVPVTDGMDTAATRDLLCAGRDVTVAMIIARGTDRLAEWERAVGWGPAGQQVFAQRDGVQVLLAATWQAAQRPDPSPCS